MLTKFYPYLSVTFTMGLIITIIKYIYIIGLVIALLYNHGHYIEHFGFNSWLIAEEGSKYDAGIISQTLKSLVWFIYI